MSNRLKIEMLNTVFMYLVFLVWFPVRQWASVSFDSSKGVWAQSTNPDFECSELHLCTHLNETFYLKGETGSGGESPFFDREKGCALLEREGIRKIYFVGDSYMRHIYQAMMITLSGDFEQGSVPAHIREHEKYNKMDCAYHRQFIAKNCSDEDRFRPTFVCPENSGGSVEMIPYKEFYYSMENLNHCRDDAEGTVTLWTGGNHAIGRGRNTVNNYETYQWKYNETICPVNRKISPHIKGAGPAGSFKQRCSLWWVSTHYRLHAYFREEIPLRVIEFNEYMRMFMEDGHDCGNVNYIDVYNMTEKLATNVTHDAKPLSYDSVHWSMEVNLMKVQLLLHAFANAGGEAAMPPRHDRYRNKRRALRV